VTAMLFSKIIVAYDGSALSKKALKKALHFMEESAAGMRPVKLEIIHVPFAPSFIFGETLVATTGAATKNMLDHAQTILDEARQFVPPHSNVKYVLRQGPPAKTILEHAEECDADLIVMGSRGLGGIREFILGSVSHNVVQHAKIPVLIVK